MSDSQWFYLRRWAYSRKQRELQQKDKPPVKKEEGKHA